MHCPNEGRACFCSGACREEEPRVWGGWVESKKNCAYCAAYPELPCAIHREKDLAGSPDDDYRLFNMEDE